MGESINLDIQGWMHGAALVEMRVEERKIEAMDPSGDCVGNHRFSTTNTWSLWTFVKSGCKDGKPTGGVQISMYLGEGMLKFSLIQIGAAKLVQICVCSVTLRGLPPAHHIYFVCGRG